MSTTESPVVEVIRDHSRQPVEIEAVTDSVYRVRDETGGVRYAKRWSPEKKQRLQTLVDRDREIGMPASELLVGEVCVQLMEPVEGRQLSKVLPGKLLPGMWRQSRDRLAGAVRQAGQYVGRLHTETRREDTQIELGSLHVDRYDAVRGGTLAAPLRDLLGDDRGRRIDGLLDRHEGVSTPTALVHGDLMLFHIYVSSRDATLIDFDRVRQAHPVEDVATFLGALDLFVRRLPYGRRSQYDLLRQSFLEGYEQTGPSLSDRGLLRTVRLIRQCSLLLYYLERVDTESPLKLRLLKSYDTRLLTRTTRSTLARTE